MAARVNDPPEKLRPGEMRPLGLKPCSFCFTGRSRRRSSPGAPRHSFQGTACTLLPGNADCGVVFVEGELEGLGIAAYEIGRNRFRQINGVVCR